MPDTRPTLAEVLLHATIALITGVIVALVVLSVTSSVFLAGYGIDYKSYTFGAGTTAAGGMWYYLLANYVFPRLRVDKPKPKRDTVITIPQVSADKRHQYIPQGCPATPEQIYTIACRVWAGAKMGYRDQSDVLGDNYNKFRDWMLREGYLTPKGQKAKVEGSIDTSGVEITPEGYKWFENFYAGPPSPTAQVYRDGSVFTSAHTDTHKEE